MISLEHKVEDCTGQWRLVQPTGSWFLRCTECYALHPPSPSNRLAAIDETYAGIYLSRLTREGRTLL